MKKLDLELLALLNLIYDLLIKLVFPLLSGQGTSSIGSTGIAQRARHPDELKKEDGKWMIDIDYYLSQQVSLLLSYPVVKKARISLLCPSLSLTAQFPHADPSGGITSVCLYSGYEPRTFS